MQSVTLKDGQNPGEPISGRPFYFTERSNSTALRTDFGTLAMEFPFQLAFVPLLGALAAGNCVILKYLQVPHTASVIEKIIGNMPAEAVH